MSKLILVTATILLAGPALAQGVAPSQPSGSGTVIENQPNTTGNDRDVTVSRGATGAETATSDSAAGGNANQPSRAVPNGSAGGGGGGNGGL
ncbi:hypothetical protein [Methylobacterium sp. WCS2018Hpa-22]|uniref:hypothetical protein n=1 Tax=Methylobacterium sp. WCS2018Hpa-22 TaxID=3073633 RepID=UPI00288BF642|nr:hypothetical protein [Methylobacterium sp. WCS2018Hpa-22]